MTSDLIPKFSEKLNLFFPYLATQTARQRVDPSIVIKKKMIGLVNF